MTVSLSFLSTRHQRSLQLRSLRLASSSRRRSQRLRNQRPRSLQLQRSRSQSELQRRLLLQLHQRLRLQRLQLQLPQSLAVVLTLHSHPARSTALTSHPTTVLLPLTGSRWADGLVFRKLQVTLQVSLSPPSTLASLVTSALQELSAPILADQDTRSLSGQPPRAPPDSLSAVSSATQRASLNSPTQTIVFSALVALVRSASRTSLTAMFQSAAPTTQVPSPRLFH